MSRGEHHEVGTGLRDGDLRHTEFFLPMYLCRARSVKSSLIYAYKQQGKARGNQASFPTNHFPSNVLEKGTNFNGIKLNMI